MFDTSNLVEVKGRARLGWTTSYFISGDGTCLAKHCATCHEILAATEFSRKAGAKYGLGNRCRTCDREYRNHPEKGNAARRRRYASRDTLEIAEDTAKTYPSGTKCCRSCREDVPVARFYPARRSVGGLQDNCKDCARRITNEWYFESLKKHWTAQGVPFNQCIYCQMMTDLTTGDLHGDHVIARAIGGPDEMSNIAPACYACNICKGEDTLEKFLAEQFFYEEDRQEILDRLRQYGYVA